MGTLRHDTTEVKTRLADNQTTNYYMSCEDMQENLMRRRKTFCMDIWNIMLICILVRLVEGGESPEKGYHEMWETFRWTDITVDRAVHDTLQITGSWPTSTEKHLQIEGATCNSTHSANQLTMQCNCHLLTSSFSLRLKKCLRNKELKQGCTLTPGSYRWDTGWLWDKTEDVLMVLGTNDEDGMVMTTAFNATTNQYEKCFVNSINEWGSNGSWVHIDDTSVTSIKPVFFKLKKIWHVSWDIQTMSNKGKEMIKGKILRLGITCEGISSQGDEQEQLASCLTFKVSGTLKFLSNLAEPTRESSRPVTTTERGSKVIETQKVIIVLAILGSVTVVALVIILFWCFHKKKACFAARRYRPKKKTTATREPMLSEKGETESHV